MLEDFKEKYNKLNKKLFYLSEKLIDEYSINISNLKKNIVIKEIKNNSDLNIKKESFFNDDLENDISGDYKISIGLSGKSDNEINSIVYEKDKFLNGLINIEKELLDFKIKYFDEYYKYYLENNKLRINELKKISSKFNINYSNKVIEKSDLIDILYLQNKILDFKIKEDDIINNIYEINNEFKYLTFNHSHVIYGNMLDIYDYTLKNNEFYSIYKKNITNNRQIVINQIMIETLDHTKKHINNINKFLKKENIKYGNKKGKFLIEELEIYLNRIETYKDRLRNGRLYEGIIFKKLDNDNEYFVNESKYEYIEIISKYSIKDKYLLNDDIYNILKLQKNINIDIKI